MHFNTSDSKNFFCMSKRTFWFIKRDMILSKKLWKQYFLMYNRRHKTESKVKKDRIKKYHGMKSRRQSVSDIFWAIFSLCAMSNFGEYLEYKSLFLWSSLEVWQMQDLQTSAYHVTVSSADAEKDNRQSSKKKVWKRGSWSSNKAEALINAEEKTFFMKLKHTGS